MQDNFVNCSLPGPCRRDQIVSTICEKASIPITIQRLSTELISRVLPRGTVVFRSVWDELNSIARNYPNMQWWISDRRLIMDIVEPPRPRQEFYEVAGKLILEMRERSPESSRFSEEQWLEIASQLEEFSLLELLPKKKRAQLADWSQNNRRSAIRTFSEAIKAKQPKWLHREALRVLYRSSEKFRTNSAAKTLASNRGGIYA